MNWKEYYKKNREKMLMKAKKWYRKNPDKVKKWRIRRESKRRLEVLVHYGGNPPKCLCCGETEIKFLTIDHIECGGSKHRKKVGIGVNFYQWLIKNNFPEGFQVLCYNCNCGRARNNGVCPHTDVRP